MNNIFLLNLSFLLINSSYGAPQNTYISKNVLRDITSQKEIFVFKNKPLNYEAVKKFLPSQFISNKQELVHFNNIENGIGISDLEISKYSSFLNNDEVSYLENNGFKRTHNSNWIYSNCKGDKACEEMSISYVAADAIFHNSLSQACQFLNSNGKFFIKNYALSVYPGGLGKVRTYEQKDDEDGFAAVYGYGERTKIYYNHYFTITLGLENFPEYRLDLDIKVIGKDEARPELKLNENIKTCLK